MTASSNSGPKGQPERSNVADLAFGLVKNDPPQARIKVMGVGGGGGNAVQRMVRDTIDHVQLICVNTDSQALRSVDVERQVHIGRETTQGLGAGANPEMGRQAAMESRDQLLEFVRKTEMLFITAGMGGGTGTGAAPVIAEMARELDILTVAVVTMPFKFEGVQRRRVAEQGIAQLREHVDSLITIPNDRLLSELGPDVELDEAFSQADAVLHSAVRGISDLITRPGRINVDFADVREVMAQQGLAMMGCGMATGADRAREASQQAINSRFLEDIEIINACGMLVNVTSNGSLTLGEYNAIAEMLQPLQADDAKVVIGTAVDEQMEDRLQVTIVAAGFESETQLKMEPPAKAPAQPNLVKMPPKHGEAREAAQVPGGAPAMAMEADHPSQKVVGADWSNDAMRNSFNIPAYLRGQHD